MSENPHKSGKSLYNPYFLIFATAGLVWALLLAGVILANLAGGPAMERLARTEPSPDPSLIQSRPVSPNPPR